MNGYIAGLDIGTSGSKITVYDSAGEYVENHYVPYDSIHSEGNHEIDPNLILNAVISVISATEHTPDALGITSFGESFVLLDKNDKIICNSMLYTDPRGEEECRSFDAVATEKITYCEPHALYSIPKLMWVMKNKPEYYERARYIFQIQDFIVYMLTGNRCIDYSLSTRTMGFDIKNLKWSSELYSAAGIDTAKMSTPVMCGTVAGISSKYGLKNTKIIVGCQDQVAAAIGAGALADGDAVDGSGSVECITPVFSKLPDDVSVCDGGYAFVPYINGMYVCYAFSYTGGTALKWFHDTFAPDTSYAELDKGVSKRVGDVLVMPHFAGSATPYMDPYSKAVFTGITLETSKSDIYKSIMEGVAYEMNVNLSYLKKFGIVPQSMLATGGGSKSPVWLQIKADITNTPFTVIDAPEVGALGTIMLSASSIGICADLAEAKEKFVKMGKTYFPDSAKHERYAEMYEKYKLIYNKMK